MKSKKELRKSSISFKKTFDIIHLGYSIKKLETEVKFLKRELDRKRKYYVSESSHGDIDSSQVHLIEKEEVKAEEKDKMQELKNFTKCDDRDLREEELKKQSDVSDWKKMSSNSQFKSLEKILQEKSNNDKSDCFEISIIKSESKDKNG